MAHEKLNYVTLPALKKRKFLSGIFILGGFGLFRIGADPFLWQKISPYYAYGAELAFVLGTSLYFRREIRLAARPSGLTLGAGLLAFFGGAAVHALAQLLNVPVPFDFSAGETVFLLLLLAPALEEGIFRLALWQAAQAALQESLPSKRTVLITAALFSASHGMAYWVVPEDFQSFVIYQTLYTLALGWLAGWVVQRSQGWIYAVFVHFAFNAGFYLHALSSG